MLPTLEGPELTQELRYELKYPVRGVTQEALLALVARHPRRFREVYPPRIVRNAYFDTPKLSSFDESLSGISERSKIRLRWYGDGLPERAALQWKQRRGRYNWKASVEVEVDPSLAHRALHRSLVDQLDPGLRPSLEKHCSLAVLNRYTRRYFATAQGRCRITIDDRLAFAVFPRSLDLRRGWIPDSRLKILEVKVVADQRRLLEEVVRSIPLRATRHSKFCQALRRSFGVSER